MKLPTVAIVGRPNVGKSTLFNKIVGKRHAIVDDTAGVTRDRNALKFTWGGKSFIVIDTGGYSTDDTQISKAIVDQVLLAIEEANMVIFVVDIKTGIVDIDTTIAKILRRKNAIARTFLAINKMDGTRDDSAIHEFQLLGLSKVFGISAESGRGVADLLDEVVNYLGSLSSIDDINLDQKTKLAVVGKPNVGKSSFVNAILGVSRQVVTETAGTTRDSIDTYFKRDGKEFILIDTAGLRKRARVGEDLEYYSVIRAQRSIERADIVILMVDAVKLLDRQDLRILNLAVQKKKGVMICLNKWDLIEKSPKHISQYMEELVRRLKGLSFVPFIFVSALTKQRIYKVVDLAYKIREARRYRVSTKMLNDILFPVFKQNPPWSKSGKEIKIKYASQLSIEPPLFAFFGNNAKQVPLTYARFLERVLRENLDLEGVPIELQFRFK